MVTAAVRNLIREGKTHQIYSAMQAGGRYGMQTMDQALAAAGRSGMVVWTIAVERCANEDDLRRLGRERMAGGPVREHLRLQGQGQSGKLVKGSLEAESTPLVANKLRQMGYVPIAIDKKRTVSVPTELHLPGMGGKVKIKEISVFSRQFATMINSGLTLLRSLHDPRRPDRQPGSPRSSTRSARTSRAGPRSRRRMAKHPKVFTRLYVAMVQAGEAGGMLDEVLLQLADHDREAGRAAGQDQIGLTYPIAVLGLVLLILSAMLLFIVPMFKSSTRRLGGALPLPTRILITSRSSFVKVLPLLILFGASAGHSASRSGSPPTGAGRSGTASS